MSAKSFRARRGSRIIEEVLDKYANRVVVCDKSCSAYSKGRVYSKCRKNRVAKNSFIRCNKFSRAFLFRERH